MCEVWMIQVVMEHGQEPVRMCEVWTIRVVMEHGREPVRMCEVWMIRVVMEHGQEPVRMCEVWMIRVVMEHSEHLECSAVAVEVRGQLLQWAVGKLAAGIAARWLAGRPWLASAVAGTEVAAGRPVPVRFSAGPIVQPLQPTLKGLWSEAHKQFIGTYTYIVHPSCMVTHYVYTGSKHTQCNWYTYRCTVLFNIFYLQQDS